MRAGTELAGRYRLEERLGRGGMGEVWSGFDQTLRRRVAIKLLLAHLLDDESAAHGVLARFRREGMAAAQLNHRNIAGVYDFGEHRQDHSERAYPFLVLEYLDGRDLKTVLEQRPSGGLPIEDVLNYGAQACDGLAAAHAAGIVHRDIKPANLMLLSDGTIKVCDFGIARIQDATAGLTKTGSQLGTPAYMAPEQLNGWQVDHRADLYALGATLYHLLTNRLVFPNHIHLTRTPDPPSSLRPGISADIDRLIISLLAKNPDQRPVAASHIAADLRAALSSVNPKVWPKPERIAIPIADLKAMAPERAAEHTRHDAVERRVTELYTKAAEQLGSDKAAVRLAGLYALERLAQDNPGHRQTIVNVICAYLRMPYALPLQPDPDAEGERQVRLTAQIILADHLRDRRTSQQRQTGKAADPRFWEDMHIDLTSAILIAPDFNHCHPATARFDGASFTGRAVFAGASFTGFARFDGASFAGDARFSGASFTRDAVFAEASFAGDADFDGASFAGFAWFAGASFPGDARFSGASFAGAARFDRASFAEGARFDGAVVAVPGAPHVWPQGWRVAVRPDGTGLLEEVGVGGGEPVPPVVSPADPAGPGTPSRSG